MRKIMLLLSLLLFAMPCFADEFQVTFFASFDFVPHEPYPAPVTVNGSFIWDTVTQTFSNPNITDTFGNTMNTLVYADFLQQESADFFHEPVGTMAGFTFAGPDASIQFSPGDHAFMDPQVIPQPGSYETGMWFYDNHVASCGCNPGSYGVTVAPIATPEPAILLLLALGLPFVCRKRP